MNHSRKLCKFDKLDLVETLDFRNLWRLKPAFKGSATRQSACEMLGIQLIRRFLQVNWSGAREFPDGKKFQQTEIYRACVVSTLAGGPAAA